MTMKKTAMKMMMMNRVINQMMLMLLMLMLMLMTKTTCMLRWLNRLTPSSLIASHSSEPSMTIDDDDDDVVGDDGDGLMVLPSVLAAASKRVAPKNCHLRVHVSRIRT